MPEERKDDGMDENKSGKRVTEQVEKLFAFIKQSPTCYQAVENVGRELEASGYRQLEEKVEWELKPGGKYYVTRNGSSLIAFRLPAKELKGFRMIASHSDSPCFKVKENADMPAENAYVRLNVEKYGGMILSTWLDRPLSVAGRIALAGNGGVRNVMIDKDLLLIPNVAIHMNRDMNKGVEYNVQTDMLPLFTGEHGEKTFLDLIAAQTGVGTEDILGTDLFLYNREEGRVFGADGEFACAPRLDDLACVYASLQAMLHGMPEEYANVTAVFDNEEVGSTTKQGAASTFLQDVLVRISEALGMTGSGYRRLLAGSFMISADNAHAVHPNHPEKADPTNRPYLNQGIVIKYHGGQKYTTDAVSAAYIKEICRQAGVPWQTYANRSDIAGGSTLGNLSAALVPVAAADIGLAQLAMHSAYETIGTKDVDYMVRAMECFFGAPCI